ncbi:hypothetical protein PWT90_09937 [Aphanocladium album]|nr:hypothetical protein PWT90_09937 [Aphanocladium album]
MGSVTPWFLCGERRDRQLAAATRIALAGVAAHGPEWAILYPIGNATSGGQRHDNTWSVPDAERASDQAPSRQAVRVILIGKSHERNIRSQLSSFFFVSWVACFRLYVLEGLRQVSQGVTNGWIAWPAPLYSADEKLRIAAKSLGNRAVTIATRQLRIGMAKSAICVGQRQRRM